MTYFIDLYPEKHFYYALSYLIVFFKFNTYFILTTKVKKLEKNLIISYIMKAKTKRLLSLTSLMVLFAAGCAVIL